MENGNGLDGQQDQQGYRGLNEKKIELKGKGVE